MKLSQSKLEKNVPYFMIHDGNIDQYSQVINGWVSYTGKTIDEYIHDKGISHVTFLTDEDFQVIYEARQIERFVSKPEVITKQQWWDMLGCLPPQDWKRYATSESFRMCEYTTSNITGTYCRIGDVYYSFADVDTLSHEQIIEKCLQEAA